MRGSTISGGRHPFISRRRVKVKSSLETWPHLRLATAGQLYSAKLSYPQPLLTYPLFLLTLTKIWCSLEYTAPYRHPGMCISNPKCLGVERLK